MEAKSSLQRQRAPTITIDTSAVSPPEIGADDATESQPPSLNSFSNSHKPASLETKESLPTSPHNVSSPTAGRAIDSQTFLSVPGMRSRGSSVDVNCEGHLSNTSHGEELPSQYVPTIELSDPSIALKPDPGTEADFVRENNKFAFTPGQLSKLINQKSLGAFQALGGLPGLEIGLQTDRTTGLSVDEKVVDNFVSFEEAVNGYCESTRVDNASIENNLDKKGIISEAPKNDLFHCDRKRIFGDNSLPKKKPKNILQLAWIAYNDKVLILLSMAALISLALGLYQTLGQEHKAGDPGLEWVEGVAIMVAIIIVVVVGAANDYQKERQFVKLNKKKDDRTIRVIRSGRTQEISVFSILVGDVVLMEPGDMVPADGIFIEGHNVRCDESSATGESDLLKKTAANAVLKSLEVGTCNTKMDPFIISGSKVAEGVGRFIVTATGVNSSFGKTMMSLREGNEVTPLQSKLNNLAENIAKLGGAAALLLFVVLFIEFLAQLPNSDASPSEKGQSFLNILIVAITVVVVAIPEGLPLAVTLALAFATTRMLKDNNLVRLLRSCETMGNATTICSDKTGTLTQNKMTVVAGLLGTSHRFGDKQTKSYDSSTGKEQRVLSDSERSPLEFASSLRSEYKFILEQSIAINSTAFEGEENGNPAFIGSKTETALLDFARSYLCMGSVSLTRSNAKIVQMVPFDSGRKCMAAVVKLPDGKYRMYVKGASEILLAKCDRIVSDSTEEGSQVTLAPETRIALKEQISTYACRSLRTIGFVFKDFESWPPGDVKPLEDDPSLANFDDVFHHMIFLGIVAIQDPLREGVREAVRDCQRAGVFVRMVTGDNVLTAQAIAEDCGILVPGRIVMKGPEFRKLSKIGMDKVIPKLCVLARSSPEDKRILVRRLKELGETVAVTGDGTNDAPALKSADVGFSMGIAGTEVAKEASAIILMDDNFSSIVKALLWGRAVNDAVKKFLQFQITVNITAVILTFVSAVASSKQESVLTAVQLLWVNLIMDTFAALALATDPPTLSLLNRKPDLKSAPLITLRMWKMIIGQSIYQLVVTFILHFAGEDILDIDSETLSTLVFNTFVWMQIFNQINNRRLDNKFNIFEAVHHNYFFVAINFLMVGGQVLIIFFGGEAFKVRELDGASWGISIILGALSLPVGVIVRLIPDELVRRCIPEALKPKPKPQLPKSNEFEWNPGLLSIRDELAFIKKVRGGRLSHLKFKLQHPRQTISRTRSSQSLPMTPIDERSEMEGTNGGLNAHPSVGSWSRRRGRSRSNSAFGAAAAMSGVIAGSIAGLSPIDRANSEEGSMNFPYGVSR